MLFHDWSISDWFDFLCCDEQDSHSDVHRDWFHREWCSSRDVNSKNSFFEKTHEATKKKTTRKKRKYSRDSKTVFSSRQLHRDSREYCAMNRKCQFNRLSTKINFINRRLWAIDETKHRWECLWCFDSLF